MKYLKTIPTASACTVDYNDDYVYRCEDTGKPKFVPYPSVEIESNGDGYYYVYAPQGEAFFGLSVPDYGMSMKRDEGNDLTINDIKYYAFLYNGEGYSLDYYTTVIECKVYDSLELFYYSGEMQSAGSVPNVEISTNIQEYGTQLKHYNASSGLQRLHAYSTISFTNHLGSITSSDLPEGWEDDDYMNTKITKCVIHKPIGTINMKAFSGCTSLTSIKIPNSVCFIGEDAFKGSGIASINIPASVTMMSQSICDSCPNLTIAIINANAEYIYGSSFENCTSLETVIINPNSAIHGISGAFNGCVKLKNINIPKNITHIYNSFENCVSLPIENNIRYADTVATECIDKNVTSITVKDGTRFLAESVFEDCSNLTEVNLPDSIEYYANNCFMNCTSITSFIFPKNSKRSDYSLFQGCTSLSSVTFNEGFEYIGYLGFKDCTSLTTIVLPCSLNYIYLNVFSDSGLVSAYLKSTTPPTLYDSSTFGSNIKAIYVPTESLSVYKNADKWSSLANLIKPAANNIVYKSLSITADNVENGLYTTTKVYYTEIVDYNDMYSGEYIENATLSGTGVSSAFEVNPSNTDSREITVTYVQDGLTATTTITQGPTHDNDLIVGDNTIDSTDTTKTEITFNNKTGRLYMFKAPETATYKFSFNDDIEGGSATDTYGQLLDLECTKALASNDDSAGHLDPQFSYACTEGTVYQVLITPYSGTKNIYGTLTISKS